MAEIGLLSNGQCCEVFLQTLSCLETDSFCLSTSYAALSTMEWILWAVLEFFVWVHSCVFFFLINSYLKGGFYFLNGWVKCWLCASWVLLVSFCRQNCGSIGGQESNFRYLARICGFNNQLIKQSPERCLAKGVECVGRGTILADFQMPGTITFNVRFYDVPICCWGDKERIITAGGRHAISCNGELVKASAIETKLKLVWDICVQN